MGNIKVLVRDLESVNFDKICRLALETYDLSFDGVDAGLGHDPDLNFDIDGAAIDRDYRKRGGRSMTESYAIRTGLGTADESGVVCVASNIPGLVSLCQTLAENHGRVPGVKGGSLYKPGKIPNYARNLSILPARASEIIGMLVKAVAEALKDPRPIHALIRKADGAWDGIERAMAAAEQKICEEARDIGRALYQGRSADGKSFPLAKATGAEPPVGISLETRNPNLMKHLWGVMKSMEPAFKVAIAVVSHPEAKRIAVLSSTEYRVDIKPIAKALAERFPETEFDVHTERNLLTWDARSGTPCPPAEQVAEIVSAHFAFRKDAPPAPTPRFGVTLGDRVNAPAKQKRR